MGKKKFYLGGKDEQFLKQKQILEQNQANLVAQLPQFEQALIEEMKRQEPPPAPKVIPNEVVEESVPFRSFKEIDSFEAKAIAHHYYKTMGRGKRLNVFERHNHLKPGVLKEILKWHTKTEIINEVKRVQTLRPDEMDDLRRLLIEKARRRIDGLNLYRPMPFQQRFHESTANERILRAANRVGKTLSAAVEVAQIVLGRGPERMPKENGVCYILGKDGREVASVLYKKLFRAGAFKIIRDAKTGEWRSFNPILPEDMARRNQTKPAPPLIPPRYVKEVAWESRKERLPKLITLTNGWELHFFSSNATAPHGADIHLAWFDEEILDPSWYPEVAARLVDHNGLFIWSATPQAGTDLLYELHERAELEEIKPRNERRIEEFVAQLDDNVHMTSEQKEDFIAKLSPEELAVRVRGEFALRQSQVYPEFGLSEFEVDYFDIPLSWTRFVAIDPGRQRCGAIFCACPPHEQKGPDDLDAWYYGDFVYFYDEIYIEQCSAELFGEAMGRKCFGQDFEAFIIDHQESRKFETASGKQIEQIYSDKLDKFNVSCRRTGHGFTWGSPNLKAGVESFRDWLRVGDQGPKLRLLAGRVPNFVWEMKRYKYKRDPQGRVTDETDERRHTHLIACARYLSQDNVMYIAPEKRKPRPGGVWLYAQKLKKGDNEGKTLHLGPKGGMV